ncbi:MAG: hypothetical protein ACE3L7_32675 [Candidatus Pristimantibacillus sp.]
MSKEELMKSFPETTFSFGTIGLVLVGMVIVILVAAGLGKLFYEENLGLVLGLIVSIFGGLLYLGHVQSKDFQAVEDWESQFYYKYVDALPVESYTISDYTKVDGKYIVKLASGNGVNEVIVENILYDATETEGYVEAKYAGLRGTKFADYNRYENVIVHLPVSDKSR